MTRSFRTLLTVLAVPLAAAAALSAGACTTTAFCFADCGSGGGGTGGNDSGVPTGSSGTVDEAGCQQIFGCDAMAADACVPTNGGVEICDGIDNDCDGIIDEGINFTDPHNCGTCATDCFTTLLFNDPATITCDQGPDPGKVPGTCHGACAAGYYDVTCNGACTYACNKVPHNGPKCDGLDDDCDGQINKGIDFCTDPNNCGACTSTCIVLHGTPACVYTPPGSDGGVGDAGNGGGAGGGSAVDAGAGDAGSADGSAGDAGAPCVPIDLDAGNPTAACTTSNTQCAIASCDCTDANNCWWNIDGNYASGCNYACWKTNGGVEICDGLDNDCDGKIDEDPTDSNLNEPCYGSPNGLCATAAHAGTFQCTAGMVQCEGANVLLQGATPETCNGIDDDCDGIVDDNLTDTGGSCGKSNLVPCQFGTVQCLPGGAIGDMLVCVGNIDPMPEVCNGIDDNCDGVIDGTVQPGDAGPPLPPADSVGPCDVPPAPWPGSTSPCRAGTKACVGGVVQCEGAIGPTSATDTCGVDANCDGIEGPQPDLTSDANNCGQCGHECAGGATQSIWTCASGMCQFQGCQTNYWDTKGNQTCSYGPCTFVSSNEICNGKDDNCNGLIDENLTVPSPTQVCGVSSAATAPECTTGVKVTCGGAAGWQCAFPAGVCTASCPGTCATSCATAIEICDGLDNNCNGLVDENVANIGQPCASDDGKPGTQGACRTTGKYVCNGPNGTQCNAVEAKCATLPGGCTELCDGIDNDCDGYVDEQANSNNPGSNPTYFVKPAVTKIASGTWIFSYEASRPLATGTTPGVGDGYFCGPNDMSDPSCTSAASASIPLAPTSASLDKTIACSVPGKVPWANVTPYEAQQTCNERGGYLCSLTDWQTACYGSQKSPQCDWGYAGSSTACTTPFTASKFCNLAVSYAAAEPLLLPTGSPLLQECWADWTTALGNTSSTGQIFDITGNLREMVADANGSFNLMGGAYTTQSEPGAECGFTFYSVTISDPQNPFKFFDTGFRCCFDADPTQ